MPIDAEIVIPIPEWIWRFLEGHPLSLEHKASKLSIREQYCNALNGSALNSVDFLSWVEIIFMNLHQINVGCWSLLVVKTCQSFLHSCCQSVLLHFQRSLIINLDLFSLFFLCVYFFSLFIQEPTWLSREFAIKFFECWCPARVCFGKWNRDWEVP